ncbi:DUF3857 domain-containing protein [Pontibacter burrus]|uniref:DUF3857 and transglutaminase domain-containing protein n=1 Tax=Pontibacter burrus TaxID=2704466 RepID=A0A6B3LMK9_9BACT|nr:DUF3857 domain-containing protein [Pontibacter burrus]NEM97979.1 DUF3857 and transglutaminase domain-containing protein [Pontibacter burrus]
MRTSFTLAVTFLFTLLFTCSHRGYAQVAKFGEVSTKELSMQHYPLDTAAEAVILFDKAYTKFGARGVSTERHIRIKILKKSGYDWANFKVPYLVKGSVAGIKGYTYTLEDGVVQKTKLDLKNAFDEKFYEDWYVKKFTMPNVKEGSVIDVEFTTYLAAAFYNLPAWEFQQTIPTAWSEYHAEIPEFLTYKFLMQGYHPLYYSNKENKASGSTNYKNFQYTWIMKDVPALKEESFITTLKDYQTKIEFELQQIRYPRGTQQISGNWDEVTKGLLQSDRFGVPMNNKGAFKNIVVGLEAQTKVPEDLAEKIYHHVQGHMTWTKGNGFGTSNNTLRKAYDEAKGNVADINLLLVTMLREAGFDANPVLVSTRENGRPPKDSPLLSRFNYVVAHVVVNGKEFLLDATEPLAPFGMLPPRALNDEGRLIKKDAGRWVTLNPKTRSQYVAIEAVFSPEGSLQGKLTESADGYYALELRKKISEQGEGKFAEDLTRELGNYSMSKPTFENNEKKNQPFLIKYDIRSTGTGQNQDIIYFNPLLGFVKKDNPFKLEERLYPINFSWPSDETIIAKYTIPAGYVVEEAPKSAVITLPEEGGKFTFMVQQQGNQLQVMSRINLNKTLFYVEEYTYLKEFYNQIIAKQAEQIVLKKAAVN